MSDVLTNLDELRYFFALILFSQSNSRQRLIILSRCDLDLIKEV